jgi:hypothetical protein
MMNRSEIQTLLDALPKKKTAKPRYLKPQSVKAFEKRYDEWYWRQHPNMTTYTHHFRDNTANGLTSLIMAWMKVNKYFAARVNTMGIYDVKRGIWRKSGSTLGMADITAVINGKHVSIEIKAGHDKPRPDQLKVQHNVEAAGGCYWFVHSFDELLQLMKTI